ncbi:SRPBCC family protein [Rhodococcus sp. T2V]|uniref:SRPBCC family protein n=1 Tax=Rhodococcus sp. T2V TaxID=3034164 RepID=UPI0023E0E438|nr:SRPBCC family protein [Rhodococcus sp. T2V]MDF3312012.1 SRPBCC family protein [Rhodococcus sp. T2V]
MDIRAQCDTTASAARVWSVLSDGWMYPVWVVGAARMRAVDDDWPAVGSRLHHSVGLWPALLNDNTEVLSAVTERELRLLARALPASQAEVTVLLEPRGTGCHLEMSEIVAHPPFNRIPRKVHDTLVYPRNRECLRRLTLIAEHQAYRQATEPRVHQ